MTKTYTNEELIELFRDDYSNSTKDVSMKTVDLYITNVKYLLDFLHNKPILDITKDDVLDYFDNIRKSDISKSTYNNRVFSARTFFNVLINNRKLRQFDP